MYVCAAWVDPRGQTRSGCSSTLRHVVARPELDADAPAELRPTPTQGPTSRCPPTTTMRSKDVRGKD
eukprot:4013937-Prorocentrum_lima.AAC.1